MSVETNACLVGLTGGLASGKSTVANIFRRRNIPVRDADRIVHDLYQAGQEGARRVGELFGESMLDEVGAVNRPALATRILADREAQQKLEEAIHPLVRREIHLWAAGEERPVLIVEAALLIETGAAASYDLIIAVVCGRAEQRRRAIARGLAPEQVDAILDLQVSDEVRRSSADLLIDNSGAPDRLPKAVDALWEKIVRSCLEKNGPR